MIVRDKVRTRASLREAVATRSSTTAIRTWSGLARSHLDSLDNSPDSSDGTHRELHEQVRRHRRRRHRHRVHRDRPRRGTAPDRRRGARRPRQHARARRRASRGAQRPPRLRVARRDPRRSDRRRRPRHLAERPPRPAGRGDPRGRQARRLREAAGHDRRANRAGLVAPGRRVRPGQRGRTSTSASIRSTSTSARSVAAGDLGAVRLVTGRYFQDWLLLETRLELATRAGQGRGAPGGRRHRLALARPHGLRHRRAGRRGHGRPRDIRPARAASRPGPSRRSRRSEPTDTVTRAIGTEDVATILLRFANGARGTLAVSQISAGRKNSLQWEIDGSRRGARPGTRSTPDQLWFGHRDRPNEILLRNPALMGAAGRAAAALPGGHVEGFGDTFGALFRAIYADVAAGRPPSDHPPYATFADGPRRDARQRRHRAERPRSAAGSTSIVRAAAGCRSPTREPVPRRPPDETRPADCAVPDHAADGRRRLDRGERVRSHRDRLLAARPAADPALCRDHRISTWPNLSAGQGRELVAEIAAKGLAHLRPRVTTRTRSIRTRPTASDGHRPPQARDHRRRARWASRSSTRSWAATPQGPRTRTGSDALRVWPDIVGVRRGRRRDGSRSRTARCSSATTSGRAGTTSPRRRGCGAGSSRHWGGTIGLNFDPSHLILQMIDIPRFIREFGPHILHVQAKDLTIDREGLYERGMLPPASAGRSRGCPASATWTGRVFFARALSRRLRRRHHHRARGPRLREDRRPRQARLPAGPRRPPPLHQVSRHDPVASRT